MLVDLAKKWFAPTEPFQLPDGRFISGQRYRKGIQEVPDHLLDSLPKGTKILDSLPVEEHQEEVVETLRDHDHTRTAHDAFVVKEEAAEKQRLMNLEDEPSLQEIFKEQEVVRPPYTGKKRGRKPKQ